MRGRTRIRRGTAWPRAALGCLALVAACLLPAAASAAGEPVFYELPPGTHAYSMTAGPEGKIWFSGRQADNGAEKAAVIGSVTPAGQVEVLRLPPGLSFGQIAAGPDGNLWVGGTYYGESGYLFPQIGRLSPDGAFAEFAPVNRVGGINSVAAGPDGAVWFTLVYWVEGRRRAAVGRIDASGVITRFPLPNRSGPGQIVAGPDGNLWFTERGGGNPKIGRITPAGQLTHFPLPNRHRRATSIAAGADGSLWFGEELLTYGRRSRSRVGRITTAGRIFQPRLPGRWGSYGVTARPDGGVWFLSPLREGPFGLGSIAASGAATPAACLKPTPCEVDVDTLALDAAGQLWFSTSKYYSHSAGGGTGLMEGIMEESEAGFVGYLPR